MSMRLIYWVAILPILAIAVCGISYFVTMQFQPPHAKPEPPGVIEVSEPAPPSQPLIPPFDEKEIKPASEIWLRWENLKKETDMPIE